jgi:PKD repeat protein
MKRGLALLLPVALVACQDAPEPLAPTGTDLSAPSFSQSQAGEAIPGQYIVVFHNGVADAPGLARRLAQQQGGEAFYTYEHALKGFAFRGSGQAAEALARNSNVAYVEQDQVMQAIATQAGATWGLDRIDARSGLDTNYTYNVTGSGVSSYVIDTGILLTHQDFGGRAVTGFDAITSGGTATDCNGHGTHVAGTMGGTTWGVAKATKLYAVRVLDCNGSGTNTGVIAGVDWVTANHLKPAVANMSLGGGASTALDDAVSNSIAAGVSYSVAAGNGDRLGRQVDACTVSPARVPNAMTIGATTNTDAKTSWSNYGNCVDFFAPGASITSAWHTSTTATNTISGTSMAAPHVAGAAALYLHANPGASPQQVRDALYNMTTKNIVTSSSTTNNHLLYTLDIKSSGGTTNAAPKASFNYSCSGLTCSFTDTSTDSDGQIASRSWVFGDGATSTATNPSRTYGASGTYTVALTVTDDKGATGTTSQTVTVSSSTTEGITLSATGYKVKGSQAVDLIWSGASGTNVDVFRDGSKITTTANDESHTDNIGTKGGGSYTYRVCEAGTSTCSGNATVTF